MVNFFHVLCNPIVSQLSGLFMFTQVEKYPPKKLLICNEFQKQMIPCEIFFFPCGRFSFQQKNEKVVSWEKFCLSFGEKVTTMKIRTSKAKKNTKKVQSIRTSKVSF
jgi:hypothetical protein